LPGRFLLSTIIIVSLYSFPTPAITLFTSLFRVYFEKPGAGGWYRYHAWRLSTPCVDVNYPENACVSVAEVPLPEQMRFFFIECFRKSAGDCQSKTSFFSRTCQQL